MYNMLWFPFFISIDVHICTNLVFIKFYCLLRRASKTWIPLQWPRKSLATAVSGVLPQVQSPSPAQAAPPTLPPPPVTCRKCWEPESVSWPTPKPWLLLATFHLHFWPVELIALFLNTAVKFEFSILTFSIMAVGLCLEQRWWYEYIDPFCLGISGHVYLLFKNLIYCYVSMGKIPEMWLSDAALDGSLISLRFQLNVVSGHITKPAGAGCVTLPLSVSLCDNLSSGVPRAPKDRCLFLCRPVFSQRPIMNDGQGHLKEWGKGKAYKIKEDCNKLTNVSFSPRGAGQGCI